MKLIVGLLLSAIIEAQSGWKTVKDKTGACQLSVPATWIVLATPGHVASPEHTETMVLVGMSPFKPFSEQTLKMLNIDKVYENSAKRSFYVTKPNGNPPLVNYHVEAPGSPNRCVAQITLRQGSQQEDAQKIASSLVSAR